MHSDMKSGPDGKFHLALTASACVVWLVSCGRWWDDLLLSSQCEDAAQLAVQH